MINKKIGLQLEVNQQSMLNSLHLQKLRIPHSRDVIHVGYYLKYIVGSVRFV